MGSTWAVLSLIWGESMSEAVLKATIKAYDEFTQQFQKFQTELRRTDQTQKQTAQGTDQLNRSTSSFLQTIGQVGALYAFQRGLQDVMGTGREFQLTIRQAQAVTDDFTSKLRDMAMATKGGSLDVYGPTEQAKAYRELGQAGASTNEIMAATPEILKFGSAAMLDLEKSASGVLATAKSFNIDLTATKQITDAYTEAMNRGALAGQDFQWIMGSTGAVAKMAGQDFREILSVGAVMRDSGIQAQDAGTSIKAALLQLINPTKEASDTMKALGVDVYDTSGKMKQWSEITAEFERVLAPFNEQSRNLALTTIFGSDGIRAMATSINKGSGYLQDFTQGLKNADGATHKMASSMSDTFDGAIKKTNASLERAKILLFEDFANSSVGFLQSINALITGFNNVDESTRKAIELLVGSMGLVVAFGLVASVIRMAVIPAFQAMGVTASAALGPWGLLIAGVASLTGVLLTAEIVAAAERAEMEEQNKAIIQVGERYEALTKKLDTLTKGTDEYKRTQEQINSLLPEIERLMPGVISQYDAEGRAIGVVNDQLRENIRLSRAAILEDARKKSIEATTKEAELEKEIRRLSGASDNPAEYDVWGAIAFTGGDPGLAKEREKLRGELVKIQAEGRRATAILEGAGYSADEDIISRLTTKTPPSGNKTFTLPDKDKKGKTAEDIAKEAFEASRKWIEYKKALNQLSAEEEVAAWERVAARYAEWTDERMEADVGLYQAKQRLINDAYSEAMDLMRHEVNMARMGTDQQIAYLEKLRTAHQWSIQQMREIEEDLYRLRKQQLSEYISRLDDEYRSSLAAIDNRTKASIQAIQGQIDSLDQEGKTQDRENALRKHNDRLAKLQKDRQYHEIRSGEDHRKAVSDIDDEIAEEHRQWEQQQQEWSRDDKKKAFQDQLDDARKKGEEERRQLEEHYKRAKQITDTKMDDIVKLLSSKSGDWEQAGKDLVNALINGLKSGDFSEFESIVNNLPGQGSGIPQELKVGGRLEELLTKWYKGNLTQNEHTELNQLAGQYAAANGSRPWENVTPIKDWKTGQPNTQPTTPTQPSTPTQKDPSQMNWQELLAYFATRTSGALSYAASEMARAGQVYTQKWEAGDVEGARAAHKWTDQIRKAIGQSMVWDSNTEISSNVHNSYAKGGPITYDQLAKIHAGEYVLNPSDVRSLGGYSGVEAWMEAARFQNAAAASSSGGLTGAMLEKVLDRHADKVIQAIEKRTGVQINTLLHADNVGFEDKSDMDIFTREMARTIEALHRSDGRVG